MATIKDVARQAGVSVATVSRVIRDMENVSAETKSTVVAAIKDLNYKPNALAQQLRRQETRTVIVIVPDIANPFFPEILHGIEMVANQNKYRILIADMQNNPEVEAHYLNTLLQKQVDGVISLSASVARSLIQRVAHDYPLVVACQYLDDSNLPNVTIDNVAAAKQVVEYLIKLGHKRIGHLTCGPSPRVMVYRDRQTGYFQALAENRIPIDMELVEYGDFGVQSGYRQMVHLLELKKPLTAVFAAGDALAIGALLALKERRIKVPEQITVVGFDDIDMASTVTPSLTTVRQPKFMMGQIAMEMLTRIMNGEPLERTKYLLDYELIIRESSGPCLH